MRDAVRFVAMPEGPARVGGTGGCRHRDDFDGVFLGTIP